VRAMTSHAPPMAFIAPGVTYRRDDDVTHSPMFHQIECFLVDEHVTMANLRGVLSEFAERFFGAGTPVRLRPSYFPFVEPGAEVDVGCPFCRRPDGSRAGCSVWQEDRLDRDPRLRAHSPRGLRELRHRRRQVDGLRVRVAWSVWRWSRYGIPGRAGSVFFAL